MELTQNIKPVKEIRDEYFDNHRKLSGESLRMLQKHLEGDDFSELCSAISLITDARLIQFVPTMAKYLTHEDWFIREIVIVSLLGRFRLPDYAEKGLEMITTDEDSGVRALAILSIGAVLDLVKDKHLQQQIAQRLLDILENKEEDEGFKSFAYGSILKGVGVPAINWPDVTKIVVKDYPLCQEKLEEFKKKYL